MCAGDSAHEECPSVRESMGKDSVSRLRLDFSDHGQTFDFRSSTATYTALGKSMAYYGTSVKIYGVTYETTLRSSTLRWRVLFYDRYCI